MEPFAIMAVRGPSSHSLPSVLDPEAVHAGADFVARIDRRVLRRGSIEERPVAAAEVLHADGSAGVGCDLEMTAGEELVRNTNVSFAADDQSGRRDFEFLSIQRTFHADEKRPGNFADRR